MTRSQPQAHETIDILMELSRLIRKLTQATGGPEDQPAMTPTQRLALFELGDGGPLRLSDLAERMGVSPPTASRSVDALHELGLVERVPDPRDRRALSIELTAPGREMLDERRAGAEGASAPAVTALSDSERETLATLLRRLTEAVH